MVVEEIHLSSTLNLHITNCTSFTSVLQSTLSWFCIDLRSHQVISGKRSSSACVTLLLWKDNTLLAPWTKLVVRKKYELKCTCTDLKCSACKYQLFGFSASNWLLFAYRSKNSLLLLGVRKWPKKKFRIYFSCSSSVPWCSFDLSSPISGKRSSNAALILLLWYTITSLIP